MKSISIETKEVVTVKYVDRIVVRSGRISLNDGAEFEVWLMNGEEMLGTEIVRIDGDDYSSWTSDDDYVYGLILQKLGMTEKQADPSAGE